MVRLKKNISKEEWGELTATQKLAWFIGLKYSEDWKTLGWFAVQTAVFVYTWRNFYSLGIFTKIFMFVWLCYHSCVASLIGHNVMHGAMFGNRILAKGIQFFLTFFFGIPMSIYLPGHNLSHHPHPQRRKDCLRTSLVTYEDSGYLPGNFWNVVLFNQFCQRPAITVDIQYIAMMMKLRRPFFYQAISEIVLILVSIVYLGYCDWLKMLILWKLPQEIAQAFMIGFSFMQHDGCDILPADDADMTKHPNISRTFTGKMWNYFSFNSGYHSIHHLHPNLIGP